MPMRGGARSTRLRPRQTSPWWRKLTDDTQRLAAALRAGGAASTRCRSRQQHVVARSTAAQCKPLQPVDGSPPQQQRTKSQLDRTEAAEVKRSLFSSPAAPGPSGSVFQALNSISSKKMKARSSPSRSPSGPSPSTTTCLFRRSSPRRATAASATRSTRRSRWIRSGSLRRSRAFPRVG